MQTLPPGSGPRIACLLDEEIQRIERLLETEREPSRTDALRERRLRYTRIVRKVENSARVVAAIHRNAG